MSEAKAGRSRPSTRKAAASTKEAPSSTGQSPAGAHRDPLLTAVDLWTAVVAGLRQAQYAEIGTTYAKLSELLVQQRTVELLSADADRPEWSQLQRVASEALQLLQPVTAAAQHLAELPRRIQPDPDRTTAPRGAGHPSPTRAARRRTPRT